MNEAVVPVLFGTLARALERGLKYFVTESTLTFYSMIILPRTDMVKILVRIGMTKKLEW